MRFAYPSQRIQDWLSQQWVIWRGRQINPAELPWLMGPFGNTDSISDDFVKELAVAEKLIVERNVKTQGLLPSIDVLELPHSDSSRLNPGIVDFYKNTARYSLNLDIQWNPLFRPFGSLVNRLYGDRLRQLNFPMNPLEMAQGITSEVVTLRDHVTHEIKYTVWYRTIKSNGRVLFSGIYATCILPSGKACVKVTFPLPRGNATVILEPKIDSIGSLRLLSSGKKFGDPGFYFLLSDSKGGYWAQYIRSFRENLTLFINKRGQLQAKHVLTLWGLWVVRFQYDLLRTD